VIVFVDKNEQQYVDKLNEILPLYAVLLKPANLAEVMSLFD